MEDPHVVENLTRVTNISLIHDFRFHFYVFFLKMKEEQDKLEKRLWEEREVIRRSHEEKARVAKTKYATLS
jgi:ribosome-binding factor A